MQFGRSGFNQVASFSTRNPANAIIARSCHAEFRVRICLKSILDTRNLTTESADKLYARFDTHTFSKLLFIIVVFIKFSRDEMHFVFICTREIVHSKLADLTIIIHDSKLWLIIQVYTQNWRYNSESRFPSILHFLYSSILSRFIGPLSLSSHISNYIGHIPFFMYYLYTMYTIMYLYSMPWDTFQLNFHAILSHDIYTRDPS